MRSSAAISAPRSCRSSRLQPNRVHVIECSSYQIDLAPSLDPSIGILINLTEDHLDRHGTMEHYAAVKERLVAGVPRKAPRSSASTTIGAGRSPARLDRCRQTRGRAFRCDATLADGIYVDGQRIMRADGAGAA